MLTRLALCLLAFNIISTAQGAYMRPFHRAIPEASDKTNGEEGSPQSFRRLLQYYRSEAGRNAGVGISTEVDSDESRASFNQPKPHLFRIDLSGRDEYDDAPYADEMLPVASYIHDETKMKPSTESTTASTTLVSTSNMTPSETTTGKPMNETDMKNMSSPIVNATETEANITMITVAPVMPSENNTANSTLDMQIKASKHEDDDAVAPPIMENEDDEDNDDEEDSEERCEEGQTKKQKCNNTCVCVDGAFFCSKKKCPSMPGMVDEQQHEHMMEKVGYTTKKGWSQRKKLPALTDCSSGMTKSIDCNQCICAQGKWACTKRSCIALTLREKASYTDGSIVKQVDGLKENHQLDEDCSEGNTREMGCNQCVCHYNSWSCTNFPCAATTPPPKPEDIEEACQREADVKSKDCNLCKCTRGIWVCTRNNCKIIGDREAGPPKFRSSSKITNIKPELTH